MGLLGLLVKMETLVKMGYLWCIYVHMYDAKSKMDWFVNSSSYDANAGLNFKNGYLII